jgi:hypothetical protein
MARCVLSSSTVRATFVRSDTSSDSTSNMDPRRDCYRYWYMKGFPRDPWCGQHSNLGSEGHLHNQYRYILLPCRAYYCQSSDSVLYRQFRSLGAPYNTICLDSFSATYRDHPVQSNGLTKHFDKTAPQPCCYSHRRFERHWSSHSFGVRSSRRQSRMRRP